MYALVDGNNFYVSCERVFRSSLLGRPVIVLSNNDGRAIARSNEAKALGIIMGAPWFQIQQKLPDSGVIALSANFTLYEWMGLPHPEVPAVKRSTASKCHDGKCELSSTHFGRGSHGHSLRRDRSRQERFRGAWSCRSRQGHAVRPNVSRTRLHQLVAALSPCTIGMEACSGAHHWARLFA